MSSTVEKLDPLTPEQFLAYPERDRFELVHGRLVEQKMSMASVWVAGQVFGKLSAYVFEHKLGMAFPDGLTYQCFNALDEDPFLVRRPDCSFIRKGRVTREQFEFGHCRVVPDLVIEVVSPNDTYHEVQQRVHQYRQAGCPLLWVIDPESRSALVYRSDGSVAELDEGKALSGEDVVPGFSVLLSTILPPVNLEETL